MSNRRWKDIVVDANVMRLYDKPKDPVFVRLFMWIKNTGALTVNQKLIIEYGRINKPQIIILLNELHRDGRLNIKKKLQIHAFTSDRHFNYTCDKKDIVHARTVFISYRKRCISFDKKLRDDINAFKKVDKKKPCACRNPDNCCLN
jgi:hypothetical protein